ncbi:SDR family NAD(P)-dependent oxidoreductase [Acuticoccus kandeliae]|uniref:SDR family NAD(P)-dependent oxidoreductase n=1 Tax=Acuticoccus kandeliae TaxID=2073160 RepID=UPI000D3E7569|nr:SDR family NAD(P)-dependent oxidoreductase [Acuticoccus kandeliae]
MTDLLTGRVAVVTGGGRGLGRSHALALAAEGAAVVVNDLGVALDGSEGGATPADTVVAEIEAMGGRAIADRSDISTAAGGEALVATALEAFGRLDILVNNAGILRDRSAHRMSPEEVEAVLAVHLHGAFNVTLPAFRAMRDAGYGRIVMTSSAAGLFGNFGQANYGAAKAGLVGLTKVLAIEGRAKGVLVNAISPCATTRMTEAGFGDKARLFGPDYVSPLVVHLASEACGVTGETFSVGGGQVARIFVGLTPGIFRAGAPLSAGEIAGRMDEIMALDGFMVPPDMAAEWDKFLALHGEAE